MRTRIPTNMDGVTSGFVQSLMRELDEMFLARSPDRLTRHSVFLSAPDKSVWEVTVDNSGTITATKVKD